MTDQQRCVLPSCHRPSTDLLCPACHADLTERLSTVPAVTTELDVALSRQVRLGGGSVGIITRTAERPLPVNLHAGDIARQLRETLSGWVRVLHEAHAVRWQQCDRCAARWYAGERTHATVDCAGMWAETIDPLTVANTAAALAAWLTRHPSWVRNHPAVDDLHRDVTDAIRAAWRAVDRPADRAYVGICSASIEDDDGQPLLDEDGHLALCPAELYALEDRDVVTCRECGTTYGVADRRRVLATALEDQLVPTGTLVGLVGRLGTALTTSAVRNLKARHRIVPKVRGGDGYIRLRVAGDDGPDLWRVGDVLDAIHRTGKIKEAG